MRTVVLLAVVSLAALAFGVATASAHGGPGGRGGGASASALVTQAAKELGVTRAKLKQAIVDAADARIDEAVADGDVESADAADLKDQADDSLQYAMAISRTKTVASNLGISTTALNDGFRAARKALVVARIDKALSGGDITSDQATALKADLDDADLPGYKAYGHGFGLDLGLGVGGSFGGGHSGPGK